MARPQELDLDQLLDHVRDLWVGVGLEGVTIRAVSARSGASNGAIYHHFSGRGHLVVTTFSREIARYLALQRELVATARSTGSPEDVVVAAALTPVEYAARTPDSALVLLATRLDQMTSGELPSPLVEELLAHGETVTRLIGELADQVWGRRDEAAVRLIRYCIDDLPVKLLIASRKPSDPLAAYAVEHAVRGILTAGVPNPG